MGLAIPLQKLGSHRRPSASLGGKQRRSQEFIRRGSVSRGEQAQELSAAHGAHFAGFYVHHADPI